MSSGGAFASPLGSPSATAWDSSWLTAWKVTASRLLDAVGSHEHRPYAMHSCCEAFHITGANAASMLMHVR